MGDALIYIEQLEHSVGVGSYTDNGGNTMKTKTTIAFSCPEKTAQIINEYSFRLGISRSACITMMCNAYIAADKRYSFSCITAERIKELESNAD